MPRTKKLPVGAKPRVCPDCKKAFRRPLTDREYQNALRIHMEASLKHGKIGGASA